MSEMPNVHLETLDWRLGGAASTGNAAARDTLGDLLQGDSEVITLRGTIRLGPTSTMVEV